MACHAVLSQTAHFVASELELSKGEWSVVTSPKRCDFLEFRASSIRMAGARQSFERDFLAQLLRPETGSPNSSSQNYSWGPPAVQNRRACGLEARCRAERVPMQTPSEEAFEEPCGSARKRLPLAQLQSRYYGHSIIDDTASDTPYAWHGPDASLLNKAHPHNLREMEELWQRVQSLEADLRSGIVHRIRCSSARDQQTDIGGDARRGSPDTTAKRVGKNMQINRWDLLSAGEFREIHSCGLPQKQKSVHTQKEKQRRNNKPQQARAEHLPVSWSAATDFLRRRVIRCAATAFQLWRLAATGRGKGVRVQSPLTPVLILNTSALSPEGTFIHTSGPSTPASCARTKRAERTSSSASENVHHIAAAAPRWSTPRVETCATFAQTDLWGQSETTHEEWDKHEDQRIFSLSLWTACAGEQGDHRGARGEEATQTQAIPPNPGLDCVPSSLPAASHSLQRVLPVTQTLHQACVAKCTELRSDKSMDQRAHTGTPVTKHHTRLASTGRVTARCDIPTPADAPAPPGRELALECEIRRERARGDELEQVVQTLWQELVTIEQARRSAALLGVELQVI